MTSIMANSIYDIPVQDAHGQTTTLAPFRDKALLIVNVASKCGLTPQYAALEALYQKFRARGFEILAFPCNQFGGQEPGSQAEILHFCETNYSVTFPIFAKIEVNGARTHALYEYLKTQCPGLLGSEAIKWNFTKFLVGPDGKVVSRFAPTTSPQALEPEILHLLPSS